MAVKKTTKKMSPPKLIEVEKQNNSISTIKKSKLPLFIGIAVVLGLFIYFFKGFFVAATVNGQPIFRFSLIQELEKQGGKRTLDSLITKTLILQEAKKQNITVDKKEVDNEIAKAEDSVKKQGQQLDAILAMQGISRENLKEQIRLEKTIEKLIAKDIQITDKEINDFIEKNKDNLSEASDSAKLKETVKDQLKRQKVSEKFQAWIADIQKQAKINYLVQYP
ncbi:MAG: SurA N-terminal domain-containing protein [Candidatus Levyibacteriota bacterium]|nr:MAG: SurA N-terminal domain-containing protein [Candidatus Levybacteria bacterium]